MKRNESGKLTFSYKLSYERRDNGRVIESVLKGDGEVNVNSMSETLSDLVRETTSKTLHKVADTLTPDEKKEPEFSDPE